MTYMYKYVALPSLPPTGGCSHEKTMNKNCWLESLSLLNNALNNPAQGFTKTPDTENFFFFLPYMYKPKKPYVHVCFPHMHSTLIQVLIKTSPDPTLTAPKEQKQVFYSSTCNQEFMIMWVKVTVYIRSHVPQYCMQGLKCMMSELQNF